MPNITDCHVGKAVLAVHWEKHSKIIAHHGHQNSSNALTKYGTSVNALLGRCYSASSIIPLMELFGHKVVMDCHLPDPVPKRRNHVKNSKAATTQPPKRAIGPQHLTPEMKWVQPLMISHTRKEEEVQVVFPKSQICHTKK